MVIILVLFVLGLVGGSFVNALVWRVHEQQSLKHKTKKSSKALSILTGRSMCPHCHHILSASDLVPLFSWLRLKGKCRYCQNKIGWHYPLVEMAVAISFIGSYLLWPYSFNNLGCINFAIWLLLIIGFAALSVYDLYWMLLPNRIVYPLIIVALVRLVVVSIGTSGSPFNVLLSGVWGLAIMSGIFYLLFQVSKGKWIGGGDVKLGIVLGLLVGGPLNGMLSLFIASALGTLLILPFIMSGRTKSTSHIPFGPLLIIGAVTVFIFGHYITTWLQSIYV
jgi:prepilin signal peptidase PulO-like enzyme (type II secretory pathway)